MFRLNIDAYIFLIISGATLLAFKLYSKLAKCANQAYEEELTDDLNQAAE